MWAGWFVRVRYIIEVSGDEAIVDGKNGKKKLRVLFVE
jgi:hypothetical protein